MSPGGRGAEPPAGPAIKPRPAPRDDSEAPHLSNPRQLAAGDYINKKMARRVDDCIKYAIVSGKKALEDAKLPMDKE